MRGHKKVRIFAEKELREYLEETKRPVLESIENENDNYLLNVDPTDYVQHKCSHAIIEELEIHQDKMHATVEEQMIPSEYFPNQHYLEKGSYKKEVYKFHIPFSGDSDLLRCRPSTRILWSTDIVIVGSEFCIDVINFDNKPETIKREIDGKLKTIQDQLRNVRAEVSDHNRRIEEVIVRKFDSRKSKVLKKYGILESLGVPIKKSENVPSTFSVPTIKERKFIKIERPEVKEKPFKPEPTINEEVYFSILQLIHDVGKQFERLPSLYTNKKEEDLRDHFLMMLEPNFDGSATGETFNKNGKTDILLRYENSNVFIAECKFWQGKKSFLKAISQLLSYLTEVTQLKIC